MGRTQHNPPKKKKEKVKVKLIKFSKMQRAYLNEIIARQQKEFNEALGTVYEDLGMAEKIAQAPPGTFILRKDFSGLDVMPAIVMPKSESEELEKPETKEEPGKEKDH